MSEVLHQANRVVTEHVKRRLLETRRAADGCGCRGCVFEFNDWIDWMDETGGLDGYKVKPRRSGDGGGGGGSDDPPDLDSGDLAEWYASGM